jgi:hypothetical protein
MKVVIGKQDFASLREHDYFYIDKTGLIEAWWEAGDDVTLITRPRRFGKTLNMSMLNCFFSNRYSGRADLFDGLNIWNNEKYRQLQGTYPVIFLSFAGVKADNLQDSKTQIKTQIAELYEQNRFLLESNLFSDNEKKIFNDMNMYMDDALSYSSLNTLCRYLERYYKKKVIMLLDEYDTPMQEAYVNGYWNEFTSFMRNIFNNTFKTNPYLERAVMTGITRVSKQSIFSDLNNLSVITTTSEKYSVYFGFTESEVFGALELFDLSERKADVKWWYDGFTFGSHTDIYNPWSIINFLSEKELKPYWASTSANSLVNKLIRTASPDVKKMMEELLNGGEIVVSFDEQIIFSQLDTDENAIWSLLMASGYLKVNSVEHRGLLRKPWYHLSITNLETLSMFSDMFSSWFSSGEAHYNQFVEALLKGNLKEMNIYMNDVALSTFSSFDTGTHPSRRSQPERFFHGFVLGLISDLRDIYEIKSNRESGYGRYDIMLIPADIHDKTHDGIVLEFKVHDADGEATLADTAQAALRQIDDKNYDAELINRGIPKSRIQHYGFAFEGKKVLISK